MINQELLDLRYRIRHSAAHVMADVVTKMFPEAKLAIGPPTAASGPTWPTQKPLVAPENLPSVINATFSPFP